MKAHQSTTTLERRILDHSARIGIIGLGYVGLPEAAMFAQAGFPVTGFDLDLKRVEKVNRGESYISDVPSDLLATLVATGRLRAMPMPVPTPAPLSASSSLLPADSCQLPTDPSPLPAARCQCDSLPAAGYPLGDQLPAGPSPLPDARSEIDLLPAAGCQLPAVSKDSFRDQDCLCICVPTPLRKTRDPDISYIVAAVQGIQPYLRPGQLVILESTTYPGTTEEVVQPMLEAKGLRAGSDFHLAFSPERVNPGDQLHPPASIPKVVGGITPACTRFAGLLYEQVVAKVLPVSSSRAAEMVKLLENTFRSVNIGLVNELALMCDRFNLDVWEIIDAAASKPFGFMPFYPGPGLGGHCIPVDPFYLSWKARSNGFEARFIELAGQVNGYMPKHVIHKLADALNDREQSLKGSRILILGVAYKPDVSDTRESPALEIIRLLRDRGAYVFYHDPHVPELKVDGILMKSIPLDTPSATERPKSASRSARTRRSAPASRSLALGSRLSAPSPRASSLGARRSAPGSGSSSLGSPLSALESTSSALGSRLSTLSSSPPPIAGFRSSDDQFPLSYFDCVVIVTHHSAIDYNFLVKNAELIVDTRNATKDVPFGREKIVKL